MRTTACANCCWAPRSRLCVPTLIADQLPCRRARAATRPKPKPKPVVRSRARSAGAPAATSSWSTFGAECGTVTVPLDYTKPEGTKIRLAVSRRPAHRARLAVPGRDAGEPGRPGGSGLIFSIFSSSCPRVPAWRTTGSGSTRAGSAPANQRSPAIPTYAGFNRPQYVPTSKKIERAWFKRTRAYTRDCDRENGRILEHLTTEDSARDMESLRRALDEPAINYYGFSYGTYLGSVYASLFPKRLRRVVFDGVVDFRDVWYKANLAQNPAFDRNMNIWFGWLARYNSVYDLGSTEAAVRRLFYATQSRLYRSPAQGVNRQTRRQRVERRLPLRGLLTVDLDRARRRVQRVRPRRRRRAARGGLPRRSAATGTTTATRSTSACICTDTSWPQRWAKWKRDNKPHLPPRAVLHLGQRLVQRAVPALARPSPDAGARSRTAASTACC